MPIEMISPRTVFNRSPLGQFVINSQYDPDKQLNQTCPINNFCLVRSISCIQHELYISGTNAVLHNFTELGDTHVFSGYTDKPIICAAFSGHSNRNSNNFILRSIFEDENKSTLTGIALFTEDVCKHYNFNTEIASCMLPCPIEQAWTLRNCLLLERSRVRSHTGTSLFTMTQCLEEITPVVFVDDIGHNGIVSDTHFRIVAICEKSLLMLVYNDKEENITLWRIRDAVKDDFENLYNTNTDGSVTAIAPNNVSKRVCTKTNNCVSMASTSSENFTHKSRSVLEIVEKTIEDLDTRSPLARSLKEINDANFPEKNVLPHHSLKNQARAKINRPKLLQEPLYPKICLQHLYNFKFQSIDSIFNPSHTMSHSTPMNEAKTKSKRNGSPPESYGEPKGFFAEDFYDRKFLCYIHSLGEQTYMHIVSFNYESFSFFCGKEEQYRILDAVYLEKLKVIVMLEENRTLSLYTGTTFICKISLLNCLIREPDLFSEQSLELSTEKIGSICRLGEPAEYGFTIYTNTGEGLRLYLPEMVRFHLVEKCLLTLKRLLPIDIGMGLLCRWYSLNRAVDDNQSTVVEWPRFVDFLLENLGFRRQSQQNAHDRSLSVDVRDLSLESMDDDICSKKVRISDSLGIGHSLNSKDHLEAYTGTSINIGDHLLVPVARTVLLAVHLVYESEKLNFPMGLCLERLASLNCALALAVDCPRYLDYYVTDQPDVWAAVHRLPSLGSWLGAVEAVWEPLPPHWGEWLSATMYGRSSRSYPVIEGLNGDLEGIMGLWVAMFRHELVREAGVEAALNHCFHSFSYKGDGTVGRCPLPSTDPVARVLHSSNAVALDTVFGRAACYLSVLGLRAADLDYVNPGLAAVVRVACLLTSDHPPETAHAARDGLYALLDRPDLGQQRRLILPVLQERLQPPIISTDWKSLRRLSQVEQDVLSFWGGNVRIAAGLPLNMSSSSFRSCHLLSVLQVDPAVRLAFPDMRIEEAYKMLQSSSPVELDVSVCAHFTAGGEEGDLPSDALKEELEGHAKTITAQRTFALAFGRGMLGLHLLRAGVLPEVLPVPPLCTAGKYLLSDSGKPHSVENATSPKSWPSFHNGVAAGLLVSPMNAQVDYVWILKQCPTNQLEKIELTPEKAGVLFGLGLNGHLNKLSQVTIGDIIKSMNEMATMAVLIGLSAYNLGSRNLALSKHISFHYRCLIPEERDNNEQIPSLCQVSAIMAAGLLNFKSCDRKMARILLDEMGRSREFLSSDGCSPVDIELTSATAGFSVGLIMFQHGRELSREYNPEEMVRLTSYLTGGTRLPAKENIPAEAPSDQHVRTLLKSQQESRRPLPISQPSDNWSSFQAVNPRVLEGENYNSDITGPGAAVALGMMFMASSDSVVARLLQLPDTFTLLEAIRSPLQCLRQIAWGMVTWREVRPSRAWVEASLPTVVRNNCLQRHPASIPEMYWETVNESYFQVLVGSCFVLGLRYAGTDNPDARDTIISYVKRLLDVRKNSDLFQSLNRLQYEWALSTVFLSACMVAAGTGNLRLLRIVRVLRSVHLPKECANYGVHTTYSLATGLLFLGGGRLTLSNSPRSAALLLVAFFPRFPPTYSGKRYHMQALRHLYVLAVRPRLMCAIDIHSRTAVPISSTVRFKTGTTRNYDDCFVYPAEDPATIDEVSFYHKDGKYSPQTYRPGTESWNILLQSFLTGGYFFVKKRMIEEDIKSIVDDRFSIAMMRRGYELMDQQLMANFLDVTECQEVDALNIRMIVTYILDQKNGIKEVLAKVAALDVDSMISVCLFYDWCQARCLLGTLSVLLMFLQTSIHGLRHLLAGEDVPLSEEAAYILQVLLE